MVEMSYLVAFVGGGLTLLSPCSALLLPAFFAYAFGNEEELLKKTGFFYVGLTTTLVPLGMGIATVSKLVYGHRGALILGSGIVVIILGILQLAGRGFDVGPLSILRSKIWGDSAGAVFALGAVYGFGGFCSGPILGAILTIAAPSGQVAQGGEPSSRLCPWDVRSTVPTGGFLGSPWAYAAPLAPGPGVVLRLLSLAHHQPRLGAHVHHSRDTLYSL